VCWRSFHAQQQYLLASAKCQPVRSQPLCTAKCLLLAAQVLLKSGRVIEGDLACLDKQGNIILNNAVEHINANGSNGNSCNNAADSSSTSSSQINSSSSSKPVVNQMGMVLIPKAQQGDVLLEVTLSERANMLSLVNGAS
jgi:small nuclear ribonucleoprotein (snRNP)-like protein